MNYVPFSVPRQPIHRWECQTCDAYHVIHGPASLRNATRQATEHLRENNHEDATILQIRRWVDISHG